MWDSDLECLMATTVTVRTQTTPDADGVMHYSTASRVYKARVSFDPAQVSRSAGSYTDAKAVAWIASTSPIDPHDSVVLPGGEVMPIMSVSMPSDETGQHHVKVVF
jgi:hypothetical protein